MTCKASSGSAQTQAWTYPSLMKPRALHMVVLLPLHRTVFFFFFLVLLLSTVPHTMVHSMVEGGGGGGGGVTGDLGSVSNWHTICVRAYC